MADLWKHTDSLTGYASTSSYETYCFAVPWVCDETFTCDRLRFYCWADSVNDVAVRLCLYDSSLNLLSTVTAEQVMDSVGWYDFTLTTPTQLVNTNTYYIGHE